MMEVLAAAPLAAAVSSFHTSRYVPSLLRPPPDAPIRASICIAVVCRGNLCPYTVFSSSLFSPPPDRRVPLFVPFICNQLVVFREQIDESPFLAPFLFRLPPCLMSAAPSSGSLPAFTDGSRWVIFFQASQPCPRLMLRPPFSAPPSIPSRRWKVPFA